MMKRFFLGFALVALLAGCGSSVKLDDVPVEDKIGTAVGATRPGGGATGTIGQTGAGPQSGVTPVDLATTAPPGPAPAGVARLVFFEYDSAAIDPQYQALLDGHARFLRADRSKKIAIEGHTDERGGREYNLALGQRRSEAVRRALGLLGVQESQMEAVSFGKEKPAVAGDNEAAWAKNRRAEWVYR